MAKCSYCGREKQDYEGTFVVDSISGKIRYFCSRKCRKSSEMHRKKRKWVINQQA